MTTTPRPKADSDQTARNLKEPGKYSEGTIKGLFLQVTATSKIWRFKYRLHGVEGLFTVGKFPDINWESACMLAQEARTSVANGIAPLKTKKARIEAQRTQEEWTFKKIAEQWLAFRSDLAAKTRSGHRGVLENHLYPVVGDVPVADLTSRHVNQLLNNLDKSPTMARHSLSLMRQILDYAMSLEMLDKNVAVRRSGLVKKHKTTHHAALVTPEDLSEYLRRLNEYVAVNDCVVSALWLLVMLPVRPSELTDMRWEDVNLDTGEWRFTMPKTSQAHIVPLPNQAVGQLRALQEHSQWLASKGTNVPTPFGKTPQTNAGKVSGWVFPSSGKFGRPISGDTLLVRIRTGLGYERGTITAHGFRATFSTLGHEALELDPIVLELCLGHRMPGALGATYARAQLLTQRREAMQKWADYVEELWEVATREQRHGPEGDGFVIPK
jgi:integrase